MFRPLTKEEEQIKKLTRDFMEKEIAPHIDEWEKTSQIPRDNLKKFAKLGIIGNLLPEELGGAGLNIQFNAIIAEEIGRVHRAMGYIFIHNMIIGIIYRYGTPEQKEKYIGPMLSGDMLSCIGITEPGCGSDAAAIQTRAVKDGDSYILKGQKCFITNADVADVYLIAAKTAPELKHKGVSLFIIDRGAQGLSVPKAESKLGIKATNICEVVMDDCVVPAENLLGATENKGFPMLMDGLETGRITNGGLAVGIAQGAYEIALKYAQERHAFGSPIADYQAIQFMLADMATEIEAARLIVAKAAWCKDAKQSAAKYASMAKRIAADVAMKVTTDAVQILGGYGYMQDYQVERYMRDAKGAQIVEGTSQIQRLIIVRELLKGN